ncbi:YaaA family protein [Microbacterium sp. GXF6406]
MRVLLPPSETKKPGGAGAPLAIADLALPALGEQRSLAVQALIGLSADADAAQRVLKLSARQLSGIVDNATLLTSPTMPAVDRYTGVLYDALDAVSLGESSRAWLGENVWIHAAPFGPISALDAIPAYRLAAGTSVPGMPPLRRHWAVPTSEAIAQEKPSFVLDLRSEAYVALGPIPDGVSAMYVRVVTDQGKALNHFNKKSKGQLVRALAQDAPDLSSFAELVKWSAMRSIVLREVDARTAELVVGE